jgi:hypothetical protein
MSTEGGILMMLLMCCTADNRAIGDEGAILIAEGLEKNTSLKVLYLGGVFPPHLLLHHVVLSH